MYYPLYKKSINMNIKEKIQAYFEKENIDLEVKDKEVKIETKQKFEDVALANGETIMVEPALEVGAAAMTTVDGEVAPLPDGDYILVDNSVLSVVEGLITNIETSEEVEEEVVEELDSEGAKTEKEKDVKRVVESIITEKQFSELKAENEALKASQVELEKKYEFLMTEHELFKTNSLKDKEELGNLFKELFAEPKEEPIVKQKNPLAKETKNIFTSVKKK